MSTHTPGPWYAAPVRRGARHIRTAAEHFDGETQGKSICTITAGAVGDRQAGANSALIATAPDLLDICREAHAYLCKFSGPEAHSLTQELAAIIAHAEGRQP